MIQLWQDPCQTFRERNAISIFLSSCSHPWPSWVTLWDNQLGICVRKHFHHKHFEETWICKLTLQVLSNVLHHQISHDPLLGESWFLRNFFLLKQVNLHVWNWNFSTQFLTSWQDWQSVLKVSWDLQQASFAEPWIKAPAKLEILTETPSMSTCSPSFSVHMVGGCSSLGPLSQSMQWRWGAPLA